MSELSEVLQLFPRDLHVDALAPAVKAGAQPLVKWAKRYAKRSERTGALRESITHKVIARRKKAHAVALVGPDRKYFHRGKGVAKGALVPDGAVRPSRYAHLIEYGHHVVAPTKGTSLRKGTAKTPAEGKKKWVPAKPFMRPAVIMARQEVAAAFRDGLARGILKIKAKLERRAKKATRIAA